MLGLRVRRARLRQVPRVRQRDLDDLVGIPRGRTAHYENGRAAAPHGYLLAISKLWGIPIAWFFQNDDSQPPDSVASTRLLDGFGRVLLKPDLGDWNAADIDQFIEVDSKFLKPGAFAARMVGAALAPKVQHGDIVIFWPSNQARIGIMSLASAEKAEPMLVIPTHTKNGVHLIDPGNGAAAKPEYSVSAFAVGIQRIMPEGDQSTLTNLTGIRYHPA